MAYDNVRIARLSEDALEDGKKSVAVRVEVKDPKDPSKDWISIVNGTDVQKIKSGPDMQTAKVGNRGVVVSAENQSFLLTFSTQDDAKSFEKKLQVLKGKNSVFSSRTEDASAEQYFQFYGYLSQQQNMMQDYIRTSTYQRAMLDNCADFQDKVVMDVGAGSGILSFFAIQAGAKKVYAIEASSMALHCQKLVENNKLPGKVIVVPGKIEEVDIPEKVDIIISEPMGYMLFNERMLETFLHAKKWLKPNGKMFPTQGDLHICPFTDESLYMEQFSKANFWYQQSFHGVDLSSLRQAAVNEYFKQPIVDTFDIRICMARSHKYTVDFQTAHESDLHNIEIPVSFTLLQSGTVHGLAFWFDVAFLGSQTNVWLSTAPTQPLTHWYQVRCLLENPIFVKQGQTLTGKVVLRANMRQSYDVEMELSVPGTNSRSSNTLDLKNPFFRYTGQTPSPPPGTNHASPSDAYWNSTDPTLTVPQQQQDQTSFGVVGTLFNGHQVIDQQLGQHQGQHGVAHSNLVQLANIAPINPGSIPAATVVGNMSQIHNQTRTSVGGGISPTIFTQTQSSPGGQQHQQNSAAAIYPVSNQFMIGDYVIPGNMVLPTQGLNLSNKSG